MSGALRIVLIVIGLAITNETCPATAIAYDRPPQCGESDQVAEPKKEQGSRVSPTAGANDFLGLPDNASRKVGDENPESELRDITKISEVISSKYSDYQRQKKAREIAAQQIRDGYVYYAIELLRHVPFADGRSAYITVTERYKARLPSRRLSSCTQSVTANRLIYYPRYRVRQFSCRLHHK